MFVTIDIVRYLGIPLLITLVVEGIVVYSLSNKNRKLTSLFILANLITNPIMNLVSIQIPYYLQHQSLLLLELTIVIVETIVLCLIVKSLPKAFLISILANLFSYMIGMLLLPLLY